MKQNGDRGGRFTIKGLLAESSRAATYFALRRGRSQRASSVPKILPRLPSDHLPGHHLRTDMAELENVLKFREAEELTD